MITWTGNSGLTEASDLGWKPGYWPERYRFQCADGIVRNFERTSRHPFGVDSVEMVYKSPRGFSVSVIND